jgi:hypothetical protein
MSTTFRSLLTAAGLAAALASHRPTAADLVTNGGFETGDFTGWTLSGNTAFTGVTTGNAHGGQWAAFSGPDGSLGELSQSIATMPGMTYTLTYFLQSDGQSPNEFRATFGDRTVDLTDLPAFGYTRETLTVTATGTSTPLGFAFRNDDGVFFLDDVSVTAVPEPGTLSLSAIGGAALFFWALRRGRTIA